MTKKPFSFFLELLFVLFFFLITSTILIEIYAKMVQISQTDTCRQDAMVIAQNKMKRVLVWVSIRKRCMIIYMMLRFQM